MKNLTQPEPFVDARLGADLLWRDVRVPRFSSPTPALFLDRDGVIIEEKEYIADPNAVVLLPGVPELIRAARAAGMAVVEVTNQAGIGRGYLGWAEFVEVERRTHDLLAEREVSVDAVFACPFHPEGRPPYGLSHAWRKPDPGMLDAAAELLNLDLARSILVGDKVADQEAGRAAGLAGGIHVLTGHGKEHQPAVRAMDSVKFPVEISADAREAARALDHRRAAVPLAGFMDSRPFHG